MASVNPAVVIDAGSGGVKVGLGGAQTPSFVYPSVDGGSNDAEEWASRYPIERGVIKNWDSLTDMLLWTLKRLDVSAEQRPLLITKPTLASQDQIDKLGEVCFETVKTSSIYVADEAVLSLYAAGLMNGLVCGSGEGLTYAVPVHSGFAVTDACIRLDMGGQDLDSYMVQCLQKTGCSLESFANHTAIAKEIKERFGKVARNFGKLSSELPENDYKLPDGQAVKIGKQAYQCPEALFNPSMMGLDVAGIHDIGDKAVQKCAPELHAELYGNVVLSGGSTMFPGFQERFKAEISSLAPKKTRINVTASPHRKHAAWMGGSILANLDKFQPMWVLKSDYDENGSSIFRKKMA